MIKFDKLNQCNGGLIYDLWTELFFISGNRLVAYVSY
jgi:hypothetical protein